MAMRSWIGHLKARWRIGRTVRFYYHPGYAPDSLARTSRVRHITLKRGEDVLGALVADGLLRKGDVTSPAPASYAALQLFHNASYLKRAETVDTLARIFGLPPEEVHPLELCWAQRLAAGGTIAGARYVLGHPHRTAVNLGGGFHHAAVERGSGFCIYNDIGVAIAQLRDHGFNDNIAIIDLDYHQGDGLLEAYEHDRTSAVYSIHGSVWSHVTSEHHAQYHLRAPIDGDRYLSHLRETLPDFLARTQPKLAFVIAGNDVLLEDDLGDFSLTPADVVQRDMFILRMLRRQRCPVVFTLGGGYSPRAWRVTAATSRYLLTGLVPQLGDTSVAHGHHYQKLLDSLDPKALHTQPEDPLRFTEEDVTGALQSAPQHDARMFGYFSKDAIRTLLDTSGVLDAVRKAHYPHAHVDFDFSDPDRQRIRVLSENRTGADKLVELVLSRRVIEGLEFLNIEWMLQQNPKADFSLDRPKLPGQEHPGLGVTHQLMGILLALCRVLDFDGLIHRPSHYHIAARTPDWRFLDPAAQGRFEAMQEALEGLHLADASHAVHDGKLSWEDGSTVEWESADRILPLSQAAKSLTAHAAIRPEKSISLVF